MTLTEARETYWFSNYHKPMGVLFDEGFLDQPRLVWAVQKSYKADIKAAAEVLLQHIKDRVPAAPVPIEVDISEEDAREVEWPFRDLKGRHIGELVDSGNLSLQDLGYAVEHTWDGKLKKAAAFFALRKLRQELSKPKENKGVLKVEGRARFLEAHREKLSFRQGALMGFVLAIGIAYLFVWIGSGHALKSVSLLQHTNWNLITIIAALIVGIPCFLLVWFANKYVERKIDAWDIEKMDFVKGQEGEDSVVDIMRESLDGSWHLFRNVVLPNHKKADIDAVLVGPVGIWIFEIKNYAGEIRNVKGDWSFKKGKEWLPLSKNPGKQARANAMNLANALSEIFAKNNMRKWVMPVVVMANRTVSLDLHSEETQVWKIQRISDELGNLNGTEIPKSMQDEICSLLQSFTKTMD